MNDELLASLHTMYEGSNALFLFGFYQHEECLPGSICTRALLDQLGGPLTFVQMLLSSQQ